MSHSLDSPTATSLADCALLTIRRHGLLREKETVLAAVSGGADSTALLDVLCSLRPALGLSLQVIHVHHGLRPEADDDARCVRDLCRHFGVPFHIEHVTVRRGAARPCSAPPWAGIEAEARRARYEAFDACSRAIGATRVATGHTADDQAETVLMRLLEGAGPRGLGGIWPLRGPYIRPLLEVRRSGIEAHLRARGLPWSEDASNRDPRFLRNRIRQDVLPFLAQACDPAIVDWLCRSAAMIRGRVDELENRAASELARLGRRAPSGLILGVSDLLRLPDELAAEVIRLAVSELGEAGPLRSASRQAIQRMVEPGRRRLRIGRVRVERSGRWLRVGLGTPARVGLRPWLVPGELVLDEIGLRLEARCFDRSPSYSPPRHPGTVAFDAERLPRRFIVRGRRPGDRFAPFGGSGARRLKSFLIDAGVPSWERERVPLLESEGEILWVAGLRRGRGAPVVPETRRILEVTLSSALAVEETPE